MSHFFAVVTVEYSGFIPDRNRCVRMPLARIVAEVLSSQGKVPQADSVEVIFGAGAGVRTGEMKVIIEIREDPVSDGESVSEQVQVERIGRAIREAGLLSGLYLKPAGATVILRIIREATSSF